MTMRGIRLLLLGLVLAGAGPVGAQTEEADTVRVVILHTNDLRGQIRRSSGDSLGGAANRAALFARVRARFPTVAVDAGDAIAPSSISSWDKGETAVRLMKMAGYDAMAPGNREFDFGLDALTRRRDEAGFPFLSANVAGAAHPFVKETIVERAGVRIGIFGLLWPGIAQKVNKVNLGGLTFGDPFKAAVEAVGRLRVAGVDYVVALVHAPGPEALRLARDTEGLDLVVAGGYVGLERIASVPVRTELMGGTLMVTCPTDGRYVGRVDLDFARTADGVRRVGAVSSLLPVDTEPDPDAAAYAADRHTAFIGRTDREVGKIGEASHEGQARIVAGLMRRHVDAEVGMVNLGAIQQVPANRPLKLRQVARLIRFDDSITRLKLTGKQLEAVLNRSASATGNAKLVFSGIDPKERLVGGRPLQSDEAYRVVTTGFLSGGGDGYAEFEKGADVDRTGILLRPLVLAGLEAWETLTLEAVEVSAGGVWRSAWSLEGSFNRNYIDGTTTAYRASGERVSFLSGSTSVAWQAATGLDLGYDVARHAWRLENRAEFGQLGDDFGDLEKSADAFESDLTYRYRARTLKVDPFASVGVGTAFLRTRSSPDTDPRRPLLVRASTGIQRQLTRLVTARVGARAQRDFVVDETDLGAEILLEGSTRIRAEGKLSSRVKSFFGLTDRRVVSIENYNTLSFPLIGLLSLSVRQSNFLYRVNAIRGVPTDGVAFRTDLTVGFVYGRDWKWY